MSEGNFSSQCGVEFVADAALPLHIRGREVPTRAAAYREIATDQELLAVTIGEPHPDPNTLVRLHSGCLTGDVLGSRRCDCGDQLSYSLERMAQAGSGVLLYAPYHEGRGIGLANKIRAYALQDSGYDTVDANSHLGFEIDGRSFSGPAMVLVRQGINSLGLLTNNPAKVWALRQIGIRVTQVAMPVFENQHNSSYLRTKRDRLGHKTTDTKSEDVQ